MRIAIVNDSALAREALRRVVLSVPEYSIAWVAEDGESAVCLAAGDRPDAILMDLIMPGVDGVEATRRIMAETPCPILIVTASVTSNFTKVAEAMRLGGIDAVNTPAIGTGLTVSGADGLLAKLEKIARGRWHTLPPGIETGLPPIVAIGASTGGPAALERILSDLPAGFPAAVIVVQHLAADFTPGLIKTLRERTRLSVRAVTERTVVEAGVVHVACTNDHMVLNSARQLVYAREPVSYAFRPSVSELFASLAERWPRPGVGVLLTGMGTDGAVGLLKLRQKGWRTIAQDEATCVVYGMPKQAAELKAADRILPLSLIAGAILAGVK